eukprot:Sdes_comp20712_c0_seq1m16395
MKFMYLFHFLVFFPASFPFFLCFQQAKTDSADSFPVFLAYIELEKNLKDIPRIVCVYERAIREHCLQASLWSSLIDFTAEICHNQTSCFVTLCLPICRRSIKNCAWEASLWIKYMAIVEKCRGGEESFDEEISGIFEAGLHFFNTFIEIQQIDSSQILDFWLFFIDCQKRKVFQRQSFSSNSSQNLTLSDAQKSSIEESCQDLRLLYHRAKNYFLSFPSASLPSSAALDAYSSYWKIMNSQIRFESFFSGNLLLARQLFEELFKNGWGKSGLFWLQYLSFERNFGQKNTLKALFSRAVRNSDDFIEEIFTEWENFERDFGTFESLQTWCQKKAQHFSLLNLQCEKYNQEKLENHDKSTLEESQIENNQPLKKKQKTSVEDFQKSHASEEEEKRTIFLSNLLFSTDESSIQDFFHLHLGPNSVEQIRLVTNIHGKSKGFAFVLLSSEQDVKKALLFDRKLLNNRPVFISLNQSNPTERGFKFSVEREEKLLF